MMTTNTDRQIQEEVVYHREFYNKINDTEQWIRLSDGCFRSCWNCYCPKDKLSYDLPEIIKNKVRFLDMNFLYAHDNPKKILKKLAMIKVNKRVVKYTFLCGLDFTLLNPEILSLMKNARVGRFNNKGNWINGLTIAWDRGLNEKELIIRSINMMEQSGYKKRNIVCFMLCNGKIPYDQCVLKLKVLKDLRVQVQDCWYNNQIRGKIKPIYWTNEECKSFGKMCRSHNIAVLQNQYDPLDKLYYN